jgi:hypothetical protein
MRVHKQLKIKTFSHSSLVIVYAHPSLVSHARARVFLFDKSITCSTSWGYLDRARGNSQQDGIVRCIRIALRARGAVLEYHEPPFTSKVRVITVVENVVRLGPEARKLLRVQGIADVEEPGPLLHVRNQERLPVVVG